MYDYETCGLSEAREREDVSAAGREVYDHEAGIALRFGKAYSLKEVGEKLGISPRQVQAHIDDGSLVAVNVGRGDERRDLRILDDDLEGFIRRRKTAAVTAVAFARPKTVTRPVPMSGPNPGYIEKRAARLARKGGC